MAARTREFAWEDTPLGPLVDWPELLLTTVNTLLGSRIPMFLWWGAELIQFYNDAYRPSLGSDKHPKALGQKGKECWPEIWFFIGPQVESVMSEGVSTWNEDQLVPIYRDGVLEDVYWTYSYSPVRAVDGTIQAVLVTCSETTDRVKADQHSHQLLTELKDSEQRLRLALAAARGVGTWSWDIPRNLVFADAVFSKTYGVDPARGAVGAPIEDFIRNVHPEDHLRVEAEIGQAIKTGEDFSSEYRLIQSDGSVRWVGERKVQLRR